MSRVDRPIVPSSIEQARRWACQVLVSQDIDNALLDVDVLLSHCLNVNRSFLYAHPEANLTDSQHGLFDELIARRAQREPVAYLIGHQEFYGRLFKVSSSVLIPRPETEILVDEVLKWSNSRLSMQPLRILDLGTGTGCLAVTLALELSDSEVWAVDVSEDALAICEANVRSHGVEERVRLSQSDLFSEVGTESDFDIIVSNPPYVEETALPSLQPDVRDYEPGIALFAGVDGMCVIRRLVAEAPSYMGLGGLLALEFGAAQWTLVKQELTDWHRCEMVRDLQGHPRVVLAER